MNGRQARSARDAARFQPTDPGLVDIRRLMFGDRFRGGFGRRDPAYMPLTAHEAAEYLFSRGAKAWDRHNSAEDLEAFVRSAPGVEQLGPDDGSQRWYNDSSRLAAKWILERLIAVPSEIALAVTFWEVMESAFPHIASMRLSTSQKAWARSAALRIIDAYRADGELERTS